MAAERKENSVLFTLKELKDITADQPDPAAAAAAAPEPKPKRQVSSFIDDAESLLADIRDSVDEEAAAEAARLEEQKRLAVEAEKRREAEKEAQIKSEMEARVAAEEARRRAAADEREAKAAAIDRAERIARGEIVDEPEPIAPAVVQQPQPPPQQTRGTGFYLVVVGLPVLCLTAVAIALIIKPAEQPNIETQVAAPVAAAPVAPPEPVAAVEEIEEEDAGVPDATPDAAPKKVATKKRRTRRAKKPKDGAAAGDKKGTGKKKLKIELGGDKGGITF